ncbi:MAG: hypothetical protein QXO71_09765, partial [Candidatus Jordarchaeaceae archaeon]
MLLAYFCNFLMDITHPSNLRLHQADQLQGGEKKGAKEKNKPNPHIREKMKKKSLTVALVLDVGMRNFWKSRFWFSTPHRRPYSLTSPGLSSLDAKTLISCFSPCPLFGPRTQKCRYMGVPPKLCGRVSVFPGGTSTATRA